MTIAELVSESYRISKEHGFHEKDVDGVSPERFGQMIALMHSELSEALEGHRTLTGAERDQNVAEEFADVVIRVADTCGAMGIDLQAAILEKTAKNEARPYKHGKKY